MTRMKYGTRCSVRYRRLSGARGMRGLSSPPPPHRLCVFTLRDGFSERAVSTAPQCHAAAPWSVGRFVNICVRTSLRSCAATGKNLLRTVWVMGTPRLPAHSLCPASVKAQSAHGCLADGTGRLREFPPGPAQGHDTHELQRGPGQTRRSAGGDAAGG